MGLATEPLAPPAFRFGDFELHPERATLLRRGARVKLQPQPLRVLTHLLHHAPAIVTRDELAAAIWPDVHVDVDQSLNYCVRQIRAALNDSAPHPRFVETLPKQGYRFIAALEPTATPTPGPTVPPSPPAPPVLPPEDLLKPESVSPRPQSPRPLRAVAVAATLLAALVALPTLTHRQPKPSTQPIHAAINPEAHDAYLRGRYLWFRGANEEAGRAFRHAIALQPNYALAWSGLADYFGQGAGQSLDPRDALPQSEAAARKAVELDPTSADAHLSLGAALYFNRWDFPAAQHEIDRALELNPRLAQAIHFRAKILSSLERHTEAIAAERAAAEIDPFARPWAIAARLLLARRYEDARQAALEHLRAEPNSLDALESLEHTNCAEGKLQDCVATRTRRLDLLGDHAAATRLRHTFAHGGYRAVLLSDLTGLNHRAARQYVSPVEFAILYNQLGQHDQALHALDQALDHHDSNLLLLQNMALFDSLHGDPHYRAIIRRIGLPPTF